MADSDKVDPALPSKSPDLCVHSVPTTHRQDIPHRQHVCNCIVRRPEIGANAAKKKRKEKKKEIIIVSH
jgi:hypothetical protein